MTIEWNNVWLEHSFEIFQNVITEVLNCIAGCRNISYDVFRMNWMTHIKLHNQHLFQMPYWHWIDVSSTKHRSHPMGAQFSGLWNRGQSQQNKHHWRGKQPFKCGRYTLNDPVYPAEWKSDEKYVFSNPATQNAWHIKRYQGQLSGCGGHGVNQAA